MRVISTVFVYILRAFLCYNKENLYRILGGIFMKYDLKQFTLEEKLNLLTGKNFWQTDSANGKLPELFLSDGPHGVRKRANGETLAATAMPSLSALANSWDPELAYASGETIADECIALEADVLLAPGVNIKRTPLCGRNFEYFSEDPLLAGTLAKAYIEGVQSKGVGACLKHFAVNNRESRRTVQSSELDERTFREIYSPAFEIALQAEPWTVMCSYNLVNGVWASENEKLLRGVLRDEFGFNGLIVSDWRAVNHSARAVKASLDLRMPFDAHAYNELKQGLDEGWITEAEIDARVEKLLELVEKRVNAEKKRKSVYTKEQNHETAVRLARECVVLLKNDDGILPIRKGNVAVGSIFALTDLPGRGDFSIVPAIGGGGSALVRTDYKPRPLHQELAERYIGVSDAPNFQHSYFVFGEAYASDTVVLCVGLSEREGYDLDTIRLSREQEELILNTAKYNENVVVVVYAGSAVDMSAWIDKVKAVVFAGFLGEGAQEAVADILSGKANPCGKLSETFPLCIEDTPTVYTQGNGSVERYTEGLLVGYRWYDTKEKDVLFPFGHGLSYSEFEYSNLQIEKKSETDYEISFNVKNVSGVDGKEISQLYVRDVLSTVERPQKELKGFAKTALKAGESKRVCISLNARSFAYYSTVLDKWHVENGTFEIYVGASSRDIRLAGKIEINLPQKEQYSLPFEM